MAYTDAYFVPNDTPSDAEGKADGYHSREYLDAIQ